MPQNNPPILLENPPESMPEQGSKDYELLLEETGGASANEGFNYEAHIAATRQQSDSTSTSNLRPHSLISTTLVFNVFHLESSFESRKIRVADISYRATRPSLNNFWCERGASTPHALSGTRS